jgi:hypothetical protein
MSFDFYLSDLLPFHGLQAQFGESPLACEKLLYFLYFHQVFHRADHTQDLRSRFHLFGGIHLFQAQCQQRQLLTLRSVDAALNLRDLDLCHI